MTSNNFTVADCDNYGAMTARTFPGCDHQQQLDHLDTMLHDIIRRIGALDPLVPLIPRALALLDPGAAMRRSWKRGKDAVPQRAATPLHVRPPSEDRGPVGA